MRPTQEEIENEPAGERMDRWVAEYVMGIDLSQGCNGEMYNEDDQRWSCTQCSKIGHWDESFSHPIQPQRYSRAMLWAWKIVTRIVGEQCDESDFFLECWADGEWFVSFKPMGYSTRKPNAVCDGKKTGKPSAPLAICRAALLKILYD